MGLELAARSPVAAARTPMALAELVAVPAEADRLRSSRG
jgi:hypothetical protein